MRDSFGRVSLKTIDQQIEMNPKCDADTVILFLSSYKIALIVTLLASQQNSVEAHCMFY